MAKPDQEDFDKTAAETAAALNLVVNNKIAAAQPKTLPAAPGAPQYIKYTPSQQGPQYNSGASHRIIRMQASLMPPPPPPPLPILSSDKSHFTDLPPCHSNDVSPLKL